MRRVLSLTSTFLYDLRCDDNHHLSITTQQKNNVINIMAELHIASKSEHTNSNGAGVPMTTPQQPPNTASVEPLKESGEVVKKTRYGWRFWIIMLGLAIIALVSGMEGVILSTALPTITRELDTGDNYVWIINVYFLTR
jgi:hypothetical protein